jgi:hypothetical protein
MNQHPWRQLTTVRPSAKRFESRAKAPGIGAQGIQDQASALRRTPWQGQKQLIVCVDNDGYEASVEKRKIYVALRASTAEKHDLLRIIDESGDYYLCPKTFFSEIELPLAVRKAALAAA